MFGYIRYLYKSFWLNKAKVDCYQTMQVILKADDLSSFNKKVKRLDNIIQKENICISWGIIGNSLEKPNGEYVNFLKTKSNDKKYHFFNHGYYHLGGGEFGYEFDGKNIDSQYTLIQATQNIAREKVGIILDAFGAPCNHIDNNTTRALDKIPEIKYWYYGNTDSSKFNIKRTIEIEDGVGNPNFEFFKKSFESRANKPNLLTLQIHPNVWSKSHFLEFILLVKYLKKCGCIFINPNSFDCI